jgi:hypothetical protein
MTPSPRILDLRLIAQRALLGAVTPGLREVSVGLQESTVLFRAVFESEEAKEREWEELSCAATEVIADFEAGWRIAEEYLVVPTGQRPPRLDVLVFERWE